MGKKGSRAAWQRASRNKKVRRPVAKSARVSANDDSKPVQAADPRALARLAENLWRLRLRAKRETSSDWAQPLLERLDDDLRDLEIEIIDRTGTRYVDGETMEKLHSDAPAGWTGGVIVTEVISPTIRIGGVVIAHGKVVVGPDATSSEDSEDADAR